MGRLLKVTITALVCWYLWFGIRMLAFALPVSHIVQTVITTVIVTIVFFTIAVKILKSK